MAFKLFLGLKTLQLVIDFFFKNLFRSFFLLTNGFPISHSELLIFFSFQDVKIIETFFTFSFNALSEEVFFAFRGTNLFHKITSLLLPSSIFGSVIWGKASKSRTSKTDLKELTGQKVENLTRGLVSLRQVRLVQDRLGQVKLGQVILRQVSLG